MIYSGCDEMSLSGLSFGADGIIGSFYNMMPEIFFKLYDAMKNNDLQTAEELQHTANILIIYSLQKNCLAVMKRALAWMGIDGGYCRSPFVNFDKAGEKKLKKEFKALKAKHKITGVDFPRCHLDPTLSGETCPRSAPARGCRWGGYTPHRDRSTGWRRGRKRTS